MKHGKRQLNHVARTQRRSPALMAALVGLSFWFAACSEVGFVPSDPDNMRLGDGSIKQTFSFNEAETQAKVDVLFIVDNSGSMYEEQQKLGARLSSFIGSLAQIDWQIGITTTDISDGLYGMKGSLVPLKDAPGYILNKNTPNYETVFQNTVVREEILTCTNPNCPSGDERPLEALMMAIEKRNTANKGFFRKGADLAVVILSDEDEGSTGATANPPAKTPTEVIDTFYAAFGTNRDMTVFGIIVPPGNSACLNQQASGGGAYGTYAAQLATLTSGVIGNICDNDYGPALEAIGNRVVERVRSVTLKYEPNPDTVRVTIIPEDPDLTWQVIGREIRFNKAPKKGTKVQVIYFPDNVTPPSQI